MGGGSWEVVVLGGGRWRWVAVAGGPWRPREETEASSRARIFAWPPKFSPPPTPPGLLKLRLCFGKQFTGNIFAWNIIVLDSDFGKIVLSTLSTDL